MKLHFVGGFLGSGKTTAIIQAARLLMAQGRQVGVITNDQGRYLVDTAFFRLADIPAMEVSGGCFCCNYNDLDERLAQLIATAAPEVIFAESVGSCADIIATVVSPLLALPRQQSASASSGLRPASFSVFADARLLRRRLMGQEMPFSDEIVYVYDQQLEEAGGLVVNKIDLLNEDMTAHLRKLVQARYPGKPLVMQSALAADGVAGWLEAIQSGALGLSDTSLVMDYTRYGAGEAQLAWLDEVIHLRVPPGQGQAAVRGLVEDFLAKITARGAAIGHLKFILNGQGTRAKLSIPTLPEPGWAQQIPVFEGEDIEILVNARVAMPAEALKHLLRVVLAESGLVYSVDHETAFHPPQPVPVHRMG